MVQKVKIVSFSWNLVPKIVRRCRIQYSMVVFISSVFDRKYQFWSNLVEKAKTVGSSWNSVPGRIQIGRIQWLYSISLFRPKTPFSGEMVHEIQNVILSWNLVPRLILICRIQWHCSLLFVLGRKHPFRANVVQKIKIVSLSWNSKSEYHHWILHIDFLDEICPKRVFPVENRKSEHHP